MLRLEEVRGEVEGRGLRRQWRTKQSTAWDYLGLTQRRQPLVFLLPHTCTILSSLAMSKYWHIAGYRRGIPGVIAGIPSIHASHWTPSATDIS